MNELTQTTTRQSEKSNGAFGSLDDAAIVRMLAFAACVLTAAVVLAHRPWSQPEGGDSAIWDYVAQCIVRGQAPYRDVVEIKAPLSAYLSAAAIAIGRTTGARDVIAARLLNTLMAGSLSAITFLVAVTYLRNRMAAIIAFLIPLAPLHFADWMSGGTEPKLPMTLFGLLSLLLVAKGRPFWAGFSSMLACLSWQPGLLFTGIAVLMFSRYLTSWRDLAAAKALLGAAFPLAALLLYFYSIGALADLWSWTIVYNLRVYAPETAKGIRESASHLGTVAVRVFRVDLVFVALSVAGMISFSINQLRAKRKQGPGHGQALSYGDALVIAPSIYLAFCLINFQSGPDLIPLFPFIGIFAGWCVAQIGDARYGKRLVRLAPPLAVALLCGLIGSRSLAFRVDSEFTLQDQEKEAGAVSSLLAPDDAIYVHGAVEILVLLNRPNLNPYIFLDRGKDDWIAKRTPGGFGAILDEMDASAPKVVAISRTGKVAHRADLIQWVENHYDNLQSLGYTGIFLRRTALK